MIVTGILIVVYIFSTCNKAKVVDGETLKRIEEVRVKDSINQDLYKRREADSLLIRSMLSLDSAKKETVVIREVGQKQIEKVIKENKSKYEELKNPNLSTDDYVDLARRIVASQQAVINRGVPDSAR